MKKIVIIFIVILLSLSGIFGIYKFYNSKKIDNKTTENIIKKNDEKKIEKDKAYETIKDCYDNEEFDMKDVVGISKGTTKQDELFDYVEAPDYLKSRIKD